MIKGQRPSKHQRIVKTNKGKKRIIVNPTIKKKNPKKRTTRKRQEPFRFSDNTRNELQLKLLGEELEKQKTNFSSQFGRRKASEMSFEELERNKEQQEAMNLSREQKDLKKFSSMKNKESNDLRNQRMLTRELQEEKKKEFEKTLFEKKKAQQTRRNLELLQKFGQRIEQAKPSKKKELYSELNIKDLLANASSNAKQSDDYELISLVREFENSFDSELDQERISKGIIGPREKKLYEAGEKMLSMPRVTKTTDITSSAPSPEEFERIMEERIRTTEKDLQTISNKGSLGIAARDEARKELLSRTGQYIKSINQEAGLSPRDRTKLKEQVVKLKRRYDF